MENFVFKALVNEISGDEVFLVLLFPRQYLRVQGPSFNTTLGTVRYLSEQQGYTFTVYTPCMHRSKR